MNVLIDPPPKSGKSNPYDYDNTMLDSKDNAAARRRRRGVLYKYVEEADNAANKVSQRMRLGTITAKGFRDNP